MHRTGKIVLSLLVLILIWGCHPQASPEQAAVQPTARVTRQPSEASTATPFPTATPDRRCVFPHRDETGSVGDYFLDSERDPGFWQRSTPEEQGLDPEILSRGLATLDESRALYNYLIVRNDYMVLEKYYNDSSRSHSHHIFSVSKSFMSALAGIALREGYLSDLNQRVSDVLPAYFNSEANWPKRNIKLRHLLSMTGGLYWGENDPNSVMLLEQQPDWVQHVIDLPMINEPGLFFTYNTGLTHLMSALIVETSGLSTCEFAYRHLFDPLDITVEYWIKDPQGIHSGGWGMYFTPRELAKFGLLYLHGGEWQGQQVLPSEWVEASLSPQINLNATLDYGYWWWLHTMQGYHVYSAEGFGGQYIHILPELDMVIVTTANEFYWSSSERFDTFAFLEEYILPAAEPTSP